VVPVEIADKHEAQHDKHHDRYKNSFIHYVAPVGDFVVVAHKDARQSGLDANRCTLI
jgi:hypothetical protein